MAFGDNAFLALWNDVEQSRDTDYNRWHTEEHVPERVSIPGILAGRRYVADRAAAHRYFTLYDLDGLATLATGPYLAVAEQPTDWSRAMRPDLRNFLRQPCRTLAQIGGGVAAHAATLRFVASTTFGRHERMAQSLMSAVRRQGTVAARLGLVDDTATFPIANMTQPSIAGDGDRFVLFVDGVEASVLSETVASASAWLETETGAVGLVSQIYRLAYVVRHDEVDPSLWMRGRKTP